MCVYIILVNLVREKPRTVLILLWFIITECMCDSFLLSGVWKTKVVFSLIYFFCHKRKPCLIFKVIKIRPLLVGICHVYLLFI